MKNTSSVRLTMSPLLKLLDVIGKTVRAAFVAVQCGR
ncbi:hypothetical protein ZBT109_0849 [Zymobacter palmae]|uniref:Uncharacterized protein n=1 Tax=Zymobacter palmae TaxID=33074 RepID=A0A348HDC3_9GAMM|nr:hypothetical protein ZBT109_0849 [Zymobacter palmae]